MNWQRPTAPAATSSPRPSTMWVCGEIGYAQITSGRHSATASATAREPSICFSMPFFHHVVVRGGRRGDVARGHFAGELLLDRGADRSERDLPGKGRKAAEQGSIRHRPADVLQRELGRRHRAGPEPVHELIQAELLEAARGIDQDGAAAREPGEDIDLVQEGRVLNDDRVGLHYRLAQPDLLVVDAAERHDWGAGALRAEARECLRILAFAERRDREHLGRGHHALTAAAVDPDLV